MPSSNGMHEKLIIDRCEDDAAQENTQTKDWRSLHLILLLSLGGHASKNALAPAEPALRALGLTPVSYAFVAATPIIGAMVMPMFWGMWFSRNEARVFVLVPLGVLLGQVILTAGLMLQAHGAPGSIYGLVLAVGLFVFSLSRAGIGVVQHSALAQVLPVGITTGFVAVIACTHATKAICQLVVPRILDVGGLTGVQLALLLPSLISFCAGQFLATQRALIPEVFMGFFTLVRSRNPSASDIPPLMSYDRKGASESPYPQAAIWLIGLWRALAVGLLHAFESVMNAYLIDQGMSADDAGWLLGRCQSIAFVYLFFVGPLGDCIGPRVLLIITSLLAFVSALTLAEEMHPFMPVLCLALVGVMAPVLPLALVPSNSKSLGRDYGMLDSLFSFAQCLFMVVIGELRERSDFHSVVVFVAAGFGGAAALAVAVAQTARG